MGEGRFSRLETNQSAPRIEPPPGAISRDGGGPVPPGTNAPGNAEDHHVTFVQRADDAFYSGNYRDALRHYSRALQLENNQIYPWIGQISCLLALKQFKEAELWSNRALEQFPEDTVLLSQRARVLAATGNLKRAIGVSDYALGRGSSPWTWLARGEILLQASDANALFCFEKAVEAAGTEDWRIPFLSGIAFSNARQWSSAHGYLLKASQMRQDNAFLWYALARAQYELSYFDQAADSLKRALSLFPQFKDAQELQRKIYRRPFLQRVFGMLRR